MFKKKIINPYLVKVQNLRAYRSSGFYAIPRQASISKRYGYGHLRDNGLGYRICLKRK